MTARTRWRALDPSGIAHVFHGTGRALCGMHWQPEIHDWPTRLRCALCQVRETQREEVEKRPVAS